MDIFNLISMFGGLAMFLYGMRLMGDGLKESSSGQLKILMEKVTNNPFKAFLLGLFVTALIQSSTATIVITSGLVAAGILTLKQSLGVVIGANVGTTVTGQILRLLSIDSNSGSFLQIFQPSTLAPIALIIGIIMIMGMKFENSKSIGNIIIGFGILFTGLMNMTNAVDALTESGVFESILTGVGSNPFLGYAVGAVVAFILQSSSASVGILQALSMSGIFTFSGVYAIIVGIYLGDCVTTAIVCYIGTTTDQKRVGITNILFNIFKSVAVLLGIFVAYSTGLLDGYWSNTVNPGIIANANTIFNVIPAIIFLPAVGLLEKISYKIVKDDPEEENPYKEKLEALNPVFYSTPALALRSCYDLILEMFYLSRKNYEDALSLLRKFDDSKVVSIKKNEDNINLFSERLGQYLSVLAANLMTDTQNAIFNQYYKVVTEFERFGDHAMNIMDIAIDLNNRHITFSDYALKDLDVLEEVLSKVLDHTEQAFKKRDIEAAYAIEPLEEVVDDICDKLEEKHLQRLTDGECNSFAGNDFMNLLSNLERISDICSNVGIAIVTRVEPELISLQHDYINNLQKQHSERFNEDYNNAKEEYFNKLNHLS